jgi:hypothetical protein
MVDPARIVTRANTGPLPVCDCSKVTALLTQNEFLMAAGSFFLTDLLCPPSTRVVLSGIAKPRVEQDARITNATRS